MIITTNEERELPAAFLRRCVVRTMSLPVEPGQLIDHLTRRGRTTFTEAEVSDGVLREVAEMLVEDRAKAEASNHRSKPGQAEYLDLLRALVELASNDEAGQSIVLNRFASFSCRKTPRSSHETESAPWAQRSRAPAERDQG